MENVIKKTRKALKPVEPFEPLRSIMKNPNSEGLCQLCGFLECSQRRSLESSGEIWRMSSKKHGKH